MTTTMLFFFLRAQLRAGVATSCRCSITPCGRSFGDAGQDNVQYYGEACVEAFHQERSCKLLDDTAAIEDM